MTGLAPGRNRTGADPLDQKGALSTELRGRQQLKKVPGCARRSNPSHKRDLWLAASVSGSYTPAKTRKARVAGRPAGRFAVGRNHPARVGPFKSRVRVPIEEDTPGRTVCLLGSPFARGRRVELPLRIRASGETSPRPIADPRSKVNSGPVGLLRCDELFERERVALDQLQDRVAEHVGVLAVVPAERRFVKVGPQVLHGELVVRTDEKRQLIAKRDRAVEALRALVKMRDLHYERYGYEKQHYIIDENAQWVRARAVLAEQEKEQP